MTRNRQIIWVVPDIRQGLLPEILFILTEILTQMILVSPDAAVVSRWPWSTYALPDVSLAETKFANSFHWNLA